jgi:hypothetical protein
MQVGFSSMPGAVADKLTPSLKLLNEDILNVSAQLDTPTNRIQEKDVTKLVKSLAAAKA